MKKYIAKLTVDKKIEKSFFVEDIHGVKVCEEVLNKSGIQIDYDLHTYLSNITGDIKFEGVIDKSKIYTLNDKLLFKVTDIPLNLSPQPPSDKERLAALEELMMGVI